MFQHFRPKAPNQEISLLDCVKRLKNFRENRIGVHIHLSGLSESNRREHYFRIATEIFITNVSAFEGQFFKLSNNDLFFIAKDAPFEALDNAVNRIRVLFSEDPLAQFTETNNKSSKFCTWYIVEYDYEILLEAVEKLHKKAEKEYARQQQQAALTAAQSGPAQQSAPAFKLDMLAKLEQTIESADLSNMIRRQTVCTVDENKAVNPLFEEIFVSIDELQKTTTDGLNLLTNRWLFQYLTSTLDRRVMAVLIRDGINSSGPFSLNLNVATVLSPDFARFEAIVTPQLRGRLVIEMDKIDVFSDMGAFLFARDYLHDRGFRICLDGLTHQILPYYDRSRLGFDLIKIYWTPGSIDEMRPAKMQEVRNIIMDAGQSRTILCRCDNETSINVGQQLGIVMFQGRHIDKMVMKPSRGRKS